ncbi:hypothetical protein ACIOJD_04120 [Streptomyces sp. NPDC088116]|uniref:hypothetical protein n=1 Tax=Streptomyces sp. NPDC088116 TaxID=3365825 RepID=UPI0037F26F5A
MTSVDAVMHTESPAGYVVIFGIDGKVVMTPQSEEHSSTIKANAVDTILSFERHAQQRRAH